MSDDKPDDRPTRPRPPPLTDEQAAVLARIEAWIADPSPSLARPRQLTLGGYAGVGKSTLLMTLITDQRLATTAVLSFTGKAVSVLRRKGLRGARTVHSFLYIPVQAPGGGVTFHRRPREDFGAVQLIVVDEAQTLNDELYNDLRDLQIPTLYVGDMGQLEPIGSNPRLMANPDLRLVTVHRQAEASPIIRLSKAFRTGDDSGAVEEVPGELEFGEYGDVQDLIYRGAVDQVVCGYNATRHRLNQAARDGRGFSGPVPVVGERLVCRQNNKQYGVFNGMMAQVVSVRVEPGARYGITFRTEDGKLLKDVPVSALQFGQDKLEYEKTTKALTYWDFGYAVTAHSAMGSEWDRVAVVEQIHEDWDWKRWSYTAATRAAKYLFYAR